jgi:glycosyltransferase involved in cell wall biosynthesis
VKRHEALHHPRIGFLLFLTRLLLGADRYAQGGCVRCYAAFDDNKNAMKLLISAYACAPHHGSEHAVGWNWITEAHRLGHTVWALVSPNHHDSITRACAERTDLASINWVFPKVPSWPLKQALEPKWERTYNLLWQAVAVGVARDLHAREGFDAIHHLTWGGVRAPTFLGLLGVPLIVGPLGGGETSPWLLRDGLHFKAKLTEAIRDLSNRTITLNPLVRRGLLDASVIFVKTPDTRRVLTQAMQKKTVEFIELGLQERQPPKGDRPHGPLRLLFAGRLLYWKGAHIAIRALAELVRRLPDARLTIVGKGKEEGRLKAAAAGYGLSNNIEFVPWLPQQQLFALYRSHDLFIFPSLHDSSGGVVLEALSFGLPVVCLDLGGPKQIVSSDSGVVVGTAGRNTAQVAGALADELFRVFESPSRLSQLSLGATVRAGRFILSERVAKFYDLAVGFIASPNCDAAADGTDREPSTNTSVRPGADAARMLHRLNVDSSSTTRSTCASR